MTCNEAGAGGLSVWCEVRRLAVAVRGRDGGFDPVRGCTRHGHAGLSYPVRWRNGSRFTNAYRSTGPRAALVVSARGSSATSAPTECIAAGLLPSSTGRAAYLPAGIAIASATQCSAADQWTALIIVLPAFIGSLAPTTTGQTCRRHPGRDG
jgi:hypothetical protein